MVNWSELVKDAGDAFTAPGPLPEGDYTFVVDDVKVGQSKAAGKKQFVLRNKVDDGSPNNGKSMTDWLTISPESDTAVEIFFGKMAGLGLTKAFFESNPTDEQIVGQIKGKRFRSRIKHQLRDGETRANFGKYFPANAAGTAPVPGGGVAASGLPSAPSIPTAAPVGPPPAPAAPPVSAVPPQAPAPAPAPQPVAAQAPAQNPWETQAPAPAAAGDPWDAPQQPQAPAPAPQPVAAAPAAQGTPDVPPPPPAPF